MIAICPNPYRDNELCVTKRVGKILREAGYETVICPVFMEQDQPENLCGLETHVLENVIGRCAMAVVIGGDGTILSVARRTYRSQTPMLGINLGTKGFLSIIEENEIEILPRAAAGEFPVSRRMMLDVELIREDKVIRKDCALNDVVIHGYGDCIRLTASCNRDIVTSYSGDGIIVSTPTGSTGYSMSAGGPIVEPDASNIIISPICAHSMAARSFVFDSDRLIRVRAERLHGRRAFLSVDGNSVEDIINGDLVSIRRSNWCTLMIDPGIRSFYELAYYKLK